MLTKNDLTERHIEMIRRELNRDPVVCRADNRVRIEDVDYEQPCNVYWPGCVEGTMKRRNRNEWHWKVEHLWQYEVLLAEGTAWTKRDAVDDMVAALIEHAREGASRRDVFRSWMRGTAKIA